MSQDVLSVAFLATLLAAGLRFATPILLAALGEIFTERSGVLNLGLEGVMLSGAFVGFLVILKTGNAFLAFGAAIIAGILIGGILAFFYVTLQANQVVVGILFNLMMVGLTSYVYRLLFGNRVLNAPRIGTQPVPFFKDLPLLGPALFDQALITYLALLLVPVASLVLYRTAFGLKLRAIGEHPRAADTLGVNVTRLRYIALLIGCGAAGAGGAFFGLQFGAFLDSMLTGRGYIALAIVIFGRWNPAGALAGAFIFGLVDAIALRLQALALPIPNQFLLMMPYLLTILALLFSIRSHSEVGSPSGPRALGTPYER
jgi:general nucleoside transport system permease protein